MLQSYQVTLTCIVCFNAKDLNVDLKKNTAFGFILLNHILHTTGLVNPALTFKKYDNHVPLFIFRIQT